MTENKRFTIKPQDDLFGVVDDYSADKVCVVNGIRTEIEAEWLCKDMNALNDENEKLKQYIYDNLDEDICDVCSYQYLEKSQMDKYYVAKCKKGYDNCSKGTVIHCNDFKFKELKE